MCNQGDRGREGITESAIAVIILSDDKLLNCTILIVALVKVWHKQPISQTLASGRAVFAGVHV